MSGGAQRLRVAVLSNAPVPYRTPMWARVAQQLDLQMVYCTEPWVDPALQEQGRGYGVHVLGGASWTGARRFLHADIGVWRLLGRLAPDVVVTTGFIPTFLLGQLWAARHRRPHAVMSDGSWHQEQSLSALHQRLRRWVYPRAAALVGAGAGTLRVFQHHGAPAQRCFLAPLCVDNERFAAAALQAAQAGPGADLLFSGRLVPHKQPLKALEIAAAVARRLARRVRLRVLGDGPLREALLQAAARMPEQVELQWLGYRPQAELPALYASAGLLLFPTQWEPWGLVANEACAAGVPVLVSADAGCAGDLVLDGVTGRVLPPRLEDWVDAACTLLQDEPLRRRLGAAAQARVREGWNFDRAAEGFVQAMACVQREQGR